MTTPRGKDDITASTYDYAGTTIAKLIRATVDPAERLLDVGAGWGKYRWLLPEYEMDAVEVWEPYVEAWRLDAYYRQVIVEDVCGLDGPRFDGYGAVILGDVLEHLPKPAAPILIARLRQSCGRLFVAVPFRLPQGAEEGNPYEEHLQDDLDEQMMADRYPLRLIGTATEPGGWVKAVYAT